MKMTKAKNDTEVNFLLRPAKQIERKLITEILHLLSSVLHISSYRYIGLGSIFFGEFIMFHKILSIGDMVSLERDENKFSRCQFNRPYGFIEVVQTETTDYLANLNWDQDLIIWLDYTDVFQKYIIEDVGYIAKNIRNGSLLIVTVNAEPPGTAGNRLNQFRDNVDRYFPSSCKETDLAPINYISVMRSIFFSRIEESFLANETVQFYQLFNFKYRDNAQMYTFGGIFSNDDRILRDSEVLRFDYISTGPELVDIRCPVLTFKEKLLLDEKISDLPQGLAEFHLKEAALESYRRYYRFYPQYFEAFF